MKKCFVVALAAFAVACSPRVKWEDLPNEEIQILGLESDCECLDGQDGISFVCKNLVDRNVTTCWQPKVEGTVVKGPVFTLSDNLVGTIAVWNGYTKTVELFEQSPKAKKVLVYNENTGEKLAEFALSGDFSADVCVLDKVVKAGEDGSVKLRLDFEADGAALAVSEVQFFHGPQVHPLCHVGARAFDGVRGPVKSFSINGEEIASYSKDGMNSAVDHSIKYGKDNTFTMSCKVTNRRYGWNNRKVTFAFDSLGRYVGSSVYYLLDRSTGNKFEILYDENNNVVSTKEKSDGGYSGVPGYDNIVYELDENGNRLSFTRDRKISGYGTKSHELNAYVIDEIDAYGNWTKRTQAGGVVDIRTIEYYAFNLCASLTEK